MKWLSFSLILFSVVFPEDIFSSILIFIVYLNLFYIVVLDYKKGRKTNGSEK